MRYVPDTDTLRNAHEDYYAPDICPGFWDFTEDKISQGELVIIDEVHKEITSPPKLVNWVNQASQGLLASTQTKHVKLAHSEAINWVKGNQQFTQRAKDDFAQCADGWLVAYAMAEDITVVTNEPHDPKIRKRVPISNVCKEFGVQYMNTCAMLRKLQARF